MQQDGFGQIHLPNGPCRDSPTLQLSAQLTVVVAEAPFHDQSLVLQGCQFLNCRPDAFHRQGGVDDISEQDQAFGPVTFQESSQPGHRGVDDSEWHQLPSRAARPGLPEVQVRDGQASTARKPYGPPGIEQHIVMEVEPVGGHGANTLAGSGGSDEEGRLTHPLFSALLL